MRRTISFGLILIFGAFFFISALLAQGNMPESGEPRELQYFTLKNLQGEDVALDVVLSQNKAVLINFWATWCPPCRDEIPSLMELQEKYKSRSFTVIGVNVGESKTKVSRFVKNAGMNYPVVLDSNTSVATQYRVIGIPFNILVRADGQILGQYYGFTDQLVADVEAVLSESPAQKSQN